jgi:hypothetical protein
MNETIEELKHITYGLDLIRRRFKKLENESAEYKCTLALVMVKELIADLESTEYWNK